jgi:hypothetical protein
MPDQPARECHSRGDDAAKVVGRAKSCPRSGAAAGHGVKTPLAPVPPIARIDSFTRSPPRLLGHIPHGLDRYFAEEAPVHHVTINPFWIAGVSVANCQFLNPVDTSTSHEGFRCVVRQPSAPR